MIKKILIITLLAIGLVGCSQLDKLSQSGSKLLLISLTGNDLEGSAGSPVIFSDVSVNNSIINDNCVASLSAVLLDCRTGCEATYYQAVNIDQVDVSFRRPDGKNTPGVDVPYSFTQPVSMLIQIDEILELPFVIIRHVAKLESPLIELRSLGQDKVLQIIADVTIHGKDLSGRRVQPVKGSITIWAANFGD